MFHIVLVEPEIPPNTGNIIRLAANTGVQLHLIRPLGFDFNDKQLRRAGLDYHEFAKVQLYNRLDEFIDSQKPEQIYYFSTKGTCRYSDVNYKPGDALIFGSETRGLSTDILNAASKQHILTLPMQADSRSLNLSNTVSIVVYEAWRQNNFV